MTIIKQRKKGSGFYFILLIIFLLCSLSLFFGGFLTSKVNNYLNKTGCSDLPEDVVKISFDQIKPEFNFVAIGDTGTGEVDQFRVAEGIRRVCEDQTCDFVLLLGDNIYPKGAKNIDDSQFDEKFENIYQPLELPFFPVLGNHDIKGDPNIQVYRSLKSPIWRMPNFDYQFDIGDASFFGINSNCSPYNWDELNDKLKEKGSKWNFVFGHHTLYSSGVHGDASIIKKGLWRIFFQDKVDFYLAGHDHQLEHLQVEGHKTEYIVSGAGGKNYSSIGEKKRTNLKNPNSRFIFQENGFVFFAVEKDAVVVKYFDAEGNKLYQFIKKKK